MILRKKIKSQVRKLKSYLAFNCKTVRDKNDPLTFMTRLKKKVDDLLDDTETFMSSLHQTNPFESNEPLRRRNSVQYERFQGMSNTGKFKYRSVRVTNGKANRLAKNRSKSKERDGYLKDTFNSKYQRHINEIQKLTHVSRESNSPSNKKLILTISRLKIGFKKSILNRKQNSIPDFENSWIQQQNP